MDRKEYLKWRRMGAINMILHHYFEEYVGQKVHMSIFNARLSSFQQQVIMQGSTSRHIFGGKNPYDQSVKFQDKVNRILHGYDCIFGLTSLYLPPDDKGRKELISIF